MFEQFRIGRDLVRGAKILRVERRLDDNRRREADEGRAIPAIAGYNVEILPFKGGGGRGALIIRAPATPAFANAKPGDWIVRYDRNGTMTVIAAQAFEEQAEKIDPGGDVLKALVKGLRAGTSRGSSARDGHAAN